MNQKGAARRIDEEEPPPVEVASVLEQGTLAMLHTLFDRDRDGVADMLDTFLIDARTRLDSLRAASRRGDHAAIAAMAHSLKGSCGNFAAHTMARLCVDLEVAHRAGALVDPIIERLDEEFGRTAHALRESFDLDRS